MLYQADEKENCRKAFKSGWGLQKDAELFKRAISFSRNQMRYERRKERKKNEAEKV